MEFCSLSVAVTPARTVVEVGAWSLRAGAGTIGLGCFLRGDIGRGGWYGKYDCGCSLNGGGVVNEGGCEYNSDGERGLDCERESNWFSLLLRGLLPLFM